MLILKKALNWRLVNDKLTVFSNNVNLEKTIRTDNNQKFYELLEFLTTPRTLEELESLVGYTNDEINDAVSYLKKHHYVKEVNGSEQIDQYARLVNFVSTYPQLDEDAYLESVRQKKALIIGVGTGGSYQLELLSKIGICHFTIIDPDQVEIKNWAAQNFSISDVGKHKVEVLKERYEQEGLSVTAIPKTVNSYHDLQEMVQIQNFDFIINTADDSALGLDIIEKVFEDHPTVELYMNGYLLQQQISFKVTKSNQVACLRDLNQKLKRHGGGEHITENSGAIFNAIFMAMSVAKMIFDGMLKINDLSLARADFLQNNFFIGNPFENEIYQKFTSAKEPLKNIINPNRATCESWICELKVDNLFSNNLLHAIKVPSEYVPFLAEKSDVKKFQNSLQQQKKFKSASEFESKLSLTDLKVGLLEFIGCYFDQAVVDQVETLIDSGRILVNRTRYASTGAYAKNDYAKPLIYVDSAHNDLTTLNYIIHEIFHVVYFQYSNQTLSHERFVRRMHTKFLFENLDLPGIKELSVDYIAHAYNEHVITELTTRYEYAQINGTLDQFCSTYPETLDALNEFHQILVSNIDPNIPLCKTKYLIPLLENYSELEKLATATSALVEGGYRHA
ncbi:MAG: ThiF family adenylyltransferase [Lactobacillaceae bacterium]|nr:ThiF family adenylyltransferase [Lactobacillaceae bacterium]